MKPIIGINLDITQGPPQEARVQAFYYEAVQKAGGIPLLVPPMPDEDLASALKRLDGLLFIGGLDYCPSSYGEELTEEAKSKLNVEIAHASRQDFDFRLIRKALENKALPVLGICAGEQLLNIELGGTLITDIPHAHPDSPVLHSSKNGWKDGFKRHTVILEKNSLLGSVYSASCFEVPTSHHQAVDKLGAGLKVAALAEDGIIEAVELEGHAFVVGVQWHPERDFEGNRALFESFISHCKTPIANSR